MKDWEIEKINGLYQQIDRLTKENQELRDTREQLKVIESKLDQLLRPASTAKTTKAKK